MIRIAFFTTLVLSTVVGWGATAQTVTRDHRTETVPAKDQVKVRDHRQSETPITIKINQRLLLPNYDYIERQADGTLNYVQITGRAVRPFPQGNIVKDRTGGITILSGTQRVQVLKNPEIEGEIVVGEAASIGNLLPMLVLGTKASQKAKSTTP